jgi:hypothetical protein
MTLNEAIEALRTWTTFADLIYKKDAVLAAYDAERAERAKRCEWWCGASTASYVQHDRHWCSHACNDAGRPVNPKVTP